MLDFRDKPHNREVETKESFFGQKKPFCQLLYNHELMMMLNGLTNIITLNPEIGKKVSGSTHF